MFCKFSKFYKNQKLLDTIFVILSIHKPSLASFEASHEIWAQSVQTFCLQTDRQDKQSIQTEELPGLHNISLMTASWQTSADTRSAEDHSQQDRWQTLSLHQHRSADPSYQQGRERVPRDPCSWQTPTPPVYYHGVGRNGTWRQPHPKKNLELKN